MNKYVLSVLCTMIFCVIQAQTIFIDSGVKYEIISSVDLTAAVSNNPLLTGIINIPASVSDGTNNYKVTTVKNYAFAQPNGSVTSITEINLPNTITSILDHAFTNNVLLTKASLGNALINIGEAAFYKTGLTSIVIPDSVKSIGDEAFFSNIDLTEITLGNSVESIGYKVFAQAEGATSSISSISLPNTLLSIPNEAFANNVLLSSVTIGNSVTSIGDSAFYKTGLTGITIPNSVTSIGNLAFFANVSLTDVTLGNAISTIGSQAFAYCHPLNNLTVNTIIAPTVNTNTFEGLSPKTINLIVPNDSFYSNQPVWEDFYDILDILDIKLNDLVKTTPNPVNDKLFIDVPNQFQFHSAIIYNTSGEVILNANKKNINLKDLSTGLYYLLISTDKGEISKKIIKK